MKRLALALLVVAPAVAHAGGLAGAMAKAKLHDAKVLARGGKLQLVSASDADDNWHLVLVDGRGRVIVLDEGGILAGKIALTSSPFFGHKDLLDVTVSSQWSNGMGGGSNERHVIVRARTFALACQFDGSSSDSMEDASSSTTVRIDKVSDRPLVWTVSAKHSASHHHGGTAGDGDPDTQVTYQLGAKGACTTSQ